MSARVLVVDDVLPNVKLLEAKLTNEYFEVVTAMDGPQALEAVSQHDPDIILLDVMMPGMDGFEVCRRLKEDPKHRHIPVVMVTALSEVADRVQGLESGADDFLTKPVNDVALFARVRSLVRIKMMTDELRLREQTSSLLGVNEEDQIEDDPKDARILIVEDRDIYARNLVSQIGETHVPVIAPPDPQQRLDEARSGAYDLIIVSLTLQEEDGLKVCSQMRSLESTRQTPLLMIVDDGSEQLDRLVKGLEIGVNDYLIRPVDKNEMLARVRTQLRRKLFEDRLRANYHMSVTMAITDPLTGLYNRRYTETHLDNLIARVKGGGNAISLLMMDIDHFKAVNDTHGHNVGDEVLREFAERIAQGVRGIDLAARYGGEEFVVVMPETSAEDAVLVAQRLRQSIADKPFQVSTDDGVLAVTVSIGLADTSLASVSDRQSLLRAADEALYEAKNQGRNRVEVAT